MQATDLESVSRTLLYDGRKVVILRPCIAVVLFSHADFTTLMTATADVLLTYLDFIPPGSIHSQFEPGPDDDEYTPGTWVAFDSAKRLRLISELRNRPLSQDNRAYSFLLSATPDGQAGDYGVNFLGMNFDLVEGYDDATSVLRLELPWNLLATVTVDALVNFIERASALFPFCCGHAGMSFIQPATFVPEAREEIHKLLPRFIGLDCAHSSIRLRMRGKTPPPHWLTILDDHLIGMLGGEQKLRLALDGCDINRLQDGLLIRAAKFPPVGDVNRGALDIGRMPVVASALKPIRFDEALFVGLKDADSGQAWIDRFNNLAPREWDNS